MEAYRSGDADAFNRLYARYRGPLYRYVLRQCGGCAEAEELYQDIWLRVIRSRRQWKPDQALSPWLFRIAHNRVVEHFRRQDKSVAVVGSSQEAEEAPDERPWQDLFAHLLDWVELFKALLPQLPPAQREAFLLKEEGGLTMEQIASVTDCGKETVKSRLRYALAALRRGLEGCDD